MPSAKLQEIISKIINEAANKLANANQELHGNLKITDFITNASLVGSKWQVDPKTSGLKPEGSLLTNKLVGPSVLNVIRQTNAQIVPALNKELNRLAVNKEEWAGNKISNHETEVNNISAEI